MKINRNSVAKYLDILLVSGHAEMVAFGPARVFFPSKRVPISTILNYVSDIIIVVDKEFKIVQVNENFLNLLDIQRESILGNKINNLFKIFLKIPELLPNIKDALDGKESSIKTSYKNENEELHFKIKLIPTTLDNGEPGVGLIIEDITKQRIAEEKLERALKEWQTTFNLTTDMISILDNDFNIIKINKAFANFLKKDPEKLIGQKCFKIIHGLKKPYNNCPCMKARQTKTSEKMKFFESNLDKNIEISVSPIFDENGEVSGSVNIFKII
jgi:PAS domain S-box-containing protein